MSGDSTVSRRLLWLKVPGIATCNKCDNIVQSLTRIL
jgi:hypothetical protein